MGKSKSNKSVPTPILSNPKQKANSKQDKKVIGLKCATWNIKRGLVKREVELREMLSKENIDVIFLTETDTKQINCETDFVIKGYKTILQERENPNDNLRIVCLVKEIWHSKMVVREDLMCTGFPSIWLEINEENKKPTILGGFYREWTQNGDKTEAAQIKRIEVFSKQIKEANKTNCDMLIMGDANLCSTKWNNHDFLNKNVAIPLKITLDQCGLLSNDVGITYLGDHVQANGMVAQSALDHVYSSKSLDTRLDITTLTNGSSDHNLVLTTIRKNINKNKRYIRKITKRSMKNFSMDKWNATLRKKDWSSVEECTDLDQKVNLFSVNIEEALDEIAPMKEFTVKSHHKFGLSDTTKNLMEKRDKTRASLSIASKQHKAVLMVKYRILRNKTTASIRNDNIEFNENRIKEANNEKEIWNIVNEVTKPRSDCEWKLKTSTGITEDEQEIANTFNQFFIQKIEDLKTGINPQMIEDPLGKLREKMKDNKQEFSLKTVTQLKVAKSLRKLKRKKSSGNDGLSQEKLVMGSDVLVNPLTSIINCSISTGQFPKKWKEAIVTPDLKKGDPQLKENYRPVSCLPAGSKLLEMIVCEQTTKYMEDNKFLPENQHGFRAKRSTMTAWANIQQEWAINTESKQMTGVMLWDLSAAFDTLDVSILIQKMELFGFTEMTRNWFQAFLTGRSQRVKIGSKVSISKNLKSGVPQGGILSPLLYILYVADLEEWLVHSKASTYADDTKTGVSGTNLDEIKKKLEEDGDNVLRYMASNGLVANPKKTSLIFINTKKQCDPIKIKIGGVEIIQEQSAKLLGITFDEDLKWNTQIHGKGGMVSSLNQRLFMIKRLKNSLQYDGLKKVSDSLFNSKLRYGLQLMGQIRWVDSDPQPVLMEKLQKTQNKLLRFLNQSYVKDRISIRSMLNKHNMLSVNQLNAQIKLTEIWKAVNDEDHPFKLVKKTINNDTRVTRGMTDGSLKCDALSNFTKNTFINDSIKAWNKSPMDLKNSLSVNGVKKAIKSFVKLLPV